MPLHTREVHGFFGIHVLHCNTGFLPVLHILVLQVLQLFAQKAAILAILYHCNTAFG